MPTTDRAVKAFLIPGLKQVGAFSTDLGSISSFDRLKQGNFVFLEECSFDESEGFWSWNALALKALMIANEATQYNTTLFPNIDTIISLR